MEKFQNIKLGADVVYQQNDEGMMIYVSEEGMVHAVNSTAANVILFVEQGCDTIEALVEKLLEKYAGVTRNELFNDVKELLNSLEELNIIQGR